MRRGDIVEVLEVKPLTVPQVLRPSEPTAERPQPTEAQQELDGVRG